MKVATIVVVVPHRCTATKPRSIQANAFHRWSGRIRRETWVSSRPRARHVPPLNTFLAAAIAINWIDICDKYWREKKHSTTSMFCCWLVCHWCDQTAGDLYHGRCSRKVRPRSASAEHQQSLESTIATRCLHQLNNPRAIIFLITFATIAFIPGPKTNQRHFDKACETLKFDANRH